MASWLVRSSLVRALAGDILLCSWARHFTLRVFFHTGVHDWVPVNTAMDWHFIQGGGGGIEIPLVASCNRDRDKLWPGSYADFTFLSPLRSGMKNSNSKPTLF